jgi:hypothetical protein
MIGNTEMISLFADSIDISTLCSRGTALHIAAAEGHLDMVKLLVEAYHADVAQVDRLGSNALHHAARSGNIECLKYLQERGLNYNDTDKKGNTVLHYACSSGSIDVVQLVLEHQSVLSIQNEWSPLHWGYRNGDPALIKLLLEHGLSESSVTTIQPPVTWTPMSIGKFHCNSKFAWTKEPSSKEIPSDTEPNLEVSDTSSTNELTGSTDESNCDDCFLVSNLHIMIRETNSFIDELRLSIQMQNMLGF